MGSTWTLDSTDTHLLGACYEEWLLTDHVCWKTWSWLIDPAYWCLNSIQFLFTLICLIVGLQCRKKLSTVEYGPTKWFPSTSANTGWSCSISCRFPSFPRRVWVGQTRTAHVDLVITRKPWGSSVFMEFLQQDHLWVVGVSHCSELDLSRWAALVVRNAAMAALDAQPLGCRKLLQLSRAAIGGRSVSLICWDVYPVIVG